MSKTVKSVVVVFTILCALFLIIFSAELILLNRDSDNSNGEPDPAGSVTAGNGNNGADKNPARGEGNSHADAVGGGASGSADGLRQPAPTGTRNEQTMPGDMKLVYYVDDALFKHTETELEDVIDELSFIDGGPAGFEIRFVFMPQGVNVFAEDFLEVNFGVGDSSVESEEPIRHSPLRGVFVSGAKNETYYESWIYKFSDPEINDLGLMFIINFQNEDQRSALHGILDTLEMVSG